MWLGWPPLGLPDLKRWLRVRLWVPLFLRRPSLASNSTACCAVKRRAPLELGEPVPQGRVLPLERGILPDERRGQAQQPLAPFPEGLDDCGCEG